MCFLYFVLLRRQLEDLYSLESCVLTLSSWTCLFGCVSVVRAADSFLNLQVTTVVYVAVASANGQSAVGSIRGVSKTR